MGFGGDGIWGREERRDWGGREPWRAGEKVERERDERRLAAIHGGWNR